jgi:DNA-binding LytR/AlgR family response regulator
MQAIKYVIVDDDDLSQNAILNLMKAYSEYSCSAQFFDVNSASAEINKIKPDLIFLDVEMPYINGFELVKYLDKSVYVIIITSHRGYAADSYEHQVSDFITKPIRQERLMQVLSRYNEKRGEQQGKLNTLTNTIPTYRETDYFFVYNNKNGNIPFKLYKKDICSIEKNGNTIDLFTDLNKKYYRDDTIKGIIDELNPKHFALINRATIINLTKANWENENLVEMKNGKSYKVSGSFYKKI